ncbi:MAG: hypothetical protein LBR48_08840 [Dysgonamonadaceae bacterium]|jgi:hypothetical protein|nr:hypothetical protein [Dysgonamonadaceae bacterium]
MDAGTIIYFIVILFVAILGFFNKSKKEQQTKDQDKGAPESPVFPSTIPDIVRKIQDARELKEIKGRRQPVPVAEAAPKQKNFAPSVSTITSSIEGQSSLKGSLYVDDSPFDGDRIGEQSPKETRPSHPLIADLAGDGLQGELRKAVLYAEILNRRY